MPGTDCAPGTILPMLPSRDVTNIGHWGTGDVELIVRNEHDLDKAKLLIEKAWQEN